MFRVILLIAIGFLIAACTPVERFSVRLNPSFFQHHESTNSRNTGPSDLFLDREGTPASPEVSQWLSAAGGVGSVLVGYANDLLRRPEPLPNNRWTWRVWQAKLFFDMDLLPAGAIVQQAYFEFEAPLINSNITAYPQREGAVNGCELRIGSARVPLSAGMTTSFGADSALPYRPTRPQFDARGATRRVNISRTAFEWRAGTRPNNGLLISPVDDGIGLEDETQYCARYVRNPRLEIIYDLPVSP